MTTTIFKVGNSNAIRIPKAILNELDLKTNDEIELEMDGDILMIKKAKKRKTIDELFENYNGTYKIEDEFDDVAVGRELL